MIQINRGFRGGNRGRTSWQEIVVLAHAIQGSYGVYGLVRLPAALLQCAAGVAPACRVFSVHDHSFH
jgi:hypothetical protein